MQFIIVFQIFNASYRLFFLILNLKFSCFIIFDFTFLVAFFVFCKRISDSYGMCVCVIDDCFEVAGNVCSLSSTGWRESNAVVPDHDHRITCMLAQ